MNRPVKKRMSKDDRRRSILGAVAIEIQDRGFKSVTTRSIAERAGVNEALLFSHFKTKKEMLEAAAREMVSGHAAPLTPVAEILEEQFFAQIGMFERYFLGLNRDNPARLKVLMYGILEGIKMPGQMDPFQPDGLVAWMVGCLIKGKNEWGFRKDLNPLEVIPMFYGALFHFILLHHLVMKRKEPLPEQMSLVENFRHMVKPRTPVA